jgi:hypothetical protein
VCFTIERFHIFMYKLVDGSARLGVHSLATIDTKEKLFDVLRQHLDNLFESKTADEKLFWATYTYYLINKDDSQIILCSRITEVYYPIFDVSVEKSNETSIKVTPYKLDYEEESIINRLTVMNLSDNCVSPLEVMGWKEDLEQKWHGKVWIRSGFTGWNTVNASIHSDFNYVPMYKL